MKRSITTITVFILFCLLSGCSRPGCSQKAGTITRLARNVTPFSHITINDNINVVLRQDSLYSAVVETDDELQSSIGVDVIGDELQLHNNASCAWIRRPGESITVYVSMPHLNKIDYQGSGTVSCADTLHLDYFTVEADHGAGTVHLLLDTRFTKALVNNEVTDLLFEGRSDSCYAWCASRGSIDFRNFQVQRLGLAYAGVRDAYVWATQSIDAVIHQSGNIYYKGNPALHTDYRSTGRLIAR